MVLFKEKVRSYGITGNFTFKQRLEAINSKLIDVLGINFFIRNDFRKVLCENFLYSL